MTEPTELPPEWLPAKTGRPRKFPKGAVQPAEGEAFIVPADVLAKIQTLAGNGWSLVGIAQSLGVSKKVFARWRIEMPEIQDAIDAGRAQSEQKVYDRLFKIATEGEDRDAVRAIELYGRLVMGWSEGAPRDADPSTARGATVTFTLPRDLEVAAVALLQKI